VWGRVYDPAKAERSSAARGRKLLPHQIAEPCSARPGQRPGPTNRLRPARIAHSHDSHRRNHRARAPFPAAHL